MKWMECFQTALLSESQLSYTKYDMKIYSWSLWLTTNQKLIRLFSLCAPLCSSRAGLPIRLHRGVCFRDSARACAVSSAWNALPPFPSIRELLLTCGPAPLSPPLWSPLLHSSGRTSPFFPNASPVLCQCISDCLLQLDCELHEGRNCLFLLLCLFVCLFV